MTPATIAPMGNLIRLDLWAEKRGRSPATVRRFWPSQPGFPEPKGTEPRVGSGKPFQLFDESELDDFAARQDAARRPKQHSLPSDPDAFRTLGGIAKLLGVDGKTITQYRELMDERAEHEDDGKQRRYRTRDVVEVLNERRGFGVASKPETDRRRPSPGVEPKPGQ